MTITFKTDGENTAVDIRPGGAGNNWKVLDPNGMIDAPSGGGRARTTLWGRGARSGLSPRGYSFTGNPNDWTFTYSYPLTAKNFLDRLADCLHDIRDRQRCGRLDDMVGYSSPGMMLYEEVTNNDTSYSEAIANPDGVQGDLRRQRAAVATIEVLVTPVAHDDISKQWSDADLNRIINIGLQRCAGNCGVATSEEDQFLAVSDRDSTPGYSGNATARLYYTLDKGATQGSVPIDLFQAADAVDVVYLGDRVVVFSPDKAPAYASFRDIVNGVLPPNLWTTCTGFSGISAPNYPRAASAPDAQHVIAVGANGRIWYSSDGAGSFTLADDGATTSQGLNAVDFQDDTLGYIGGDNGTLLRIINRDNSLTITRVVVTDGTTTVSSNINTVRTPPMRGAEVVLGTANGQVWRSRNATDTRPTFESLSFPGAGNGSIKDIGFVGYRGDQMFVLQNDTSGATRVLRDHSGGAMGTDVEVVGGYNTPSNFGINSIAMANVNFGLTVGQIHESYGFIGQIRPNNLA